MFNFTFIKYSTLTAGIVSLVNLSSFCTPSKAASITNGGFEAGFSGWTVLGENNPLSPIESPPSGSPDGDAVRWFTTSGEVSPLSNTEILEAFEGESYAVTDHEESGSIVLYQDITLEQNIQHTLSFAWFAQSERPFADSGSMSLGFPCCFQGPVQQFRVDIVPAGFTDFFGTSSETGVLANVVEPVAESFPVTEWNTTTFDLTPWAGSTIRLAFREAAIGGEFQAGVDAVEIKSVPEPSSALGLLAFCGLGVGSLVKRKQKKHKRILIN